MSDNPNFIANMSSDEVYYGQDMTLCLTDVVADKADVDHSHSGYASTEHTHSGYASQSDLDLLEDVVDTKADAIHTHSGYALSSHSHSDYATVIALDTLGEEVDGKASVDHSHAEYATLSHIHSDYAAVNHDHDEDYALISHAHSDYATIVALNEVSATVSEKANASHSHDDLYYTETEVDTKLAGKADVSHTHTGIYDASGAAANALTSANAYTDSKIDALVGDGASTTLDTIGEISSAIEDNQDAIDLLNAAIGNKANASDLTSHTGNTVIHVTESDKNNWNIAKTHADITHAPSNAEKNQNAFSNVVVGNTTIAADTTTDTLTFVAGNNVTLTPNAEGDSITIASTNTVYTHPVSAGNKHIPAGGSSGQILRWSADGTAVWGVDNNTTYSNATQTSSGLMSNTDKTKLDGIAESANNYVLPSAGSSLGGVKTGGDVTISSGVITINDDSHNHVISNIDGLQDALDAKAVSGHNHNDVYYTQTQVDIKDSTTLASAKTYADGLNAAMDTRMDNAENKLNTIASGAEVNQNAFGNIIVGTTTIVADAKTDSLTIAAGTGISVAGDATNDKVTITNSGVRSIATGSSDGTISVNTNGTSANVAVKGLGSAAYTASTAYDAAGTAQTKVNEALVSAKAYADGIKNDLLNGAGTAYDTLKELGDLIDENTDAIDALETVAASKASTSDLTSHTSNKSNPHNVTLAQLGVTATASELNKMDGITATTAELNIMDGVTATTAEINYLDGVTASIQTQLNAKAASSHTHNYAGSSSAGGAATSANKLATARTITLTGDVSGSTSFDGSGNVSITATVADDSHNHIISNIDSLQSALDGKSATSHTHTAQSLVSMADALFATSYNGGVEFSYSSDSGKNVLTEISNMTAGLHTIYSIAGNAGNPKTSESWRMLVHKTSVTIGWVLAFDAQGSIYSNYQSAAGTFKGWRCIYDVTPPILWMGEYWCTDTQTVTPSKALSECRNGWVLVWSDYDTANETATNGDCFTTVIPKWNPNHVKWSGQSFIAAVPTNLSADGAISFAGKRLYVHDTKITGNTVNDVSPANDVCLRAIYEY